ncbi:MAG: MATE family efflux transporter [Ruminiclostridium sp.]|nr:MATE family efflux transporter [Ruminiclostridium sp.]
MGGTVGENKMGVMPIHRLLLTMSGPMMLSMLIQALYNVVDSMFVSYINESALTAVSLAYPVQNLMIAVATGTGVGVNALLSRSLGEKNYEAANRAAGNALFLSGLSCVLFSVFGTIFARAYFALQVTDPEIISLGKDYLFYIMLFSVGGFGQVMFSRLLQSTGKTFYSMVIQLAGAVLNIILDPLLIFGLGGFPALGVAGAAIATVVSQMVGMALGVYFNLKKNPEIQFSLSDLRPSLPIIARIYSVGVPSILLQTVASLLTFGLNQILVSFSETATAVYGVYFKLQGFAFLPIIGMNNGMVPIVAYNYGARKPERIVQTIRLAICYAVGIMVVAVVIFQLWPDKLLGIFRASEAMLAIGVPALKTLSLCFLVGGFTIVSSSVFQALGMGLLSMTISVVRQLLLVLPLAYMFSLSGKLDLVWWSFPVAEVLAGALAAVFLRRAYLRVIRPLRELDYQF